MTNQSIKPKIQKLKESIINHALEMGFNGVRFCSVEPLLDSEQRFFEWRERGLAGEMNYLLRDNPKNARPKELLENAKSIIIFTSNYYTEAPSRPSNDHGRVASYAVGFDYHKVLKKKIKELIQTVYDDVNGDLRGILDKSKIFTDAVPLMEKSFAKKAGLGFKGKNTLLISRETGSFNFISEILTDIDFEADSEISLMSDASCAGCTRCIDICPTDALIGEHQIDARLCISYLSIETKGLIDEKLRPGIGEWLFGCDLCQTICPYNKKGDIETKWQEFRPENGVGHWLYLPDILSMDPLVSDKYQNEEDADKAFHEWLCRTPLTRPKRKGLIRNSMIVAANSKSEKSRVFIEKYSQHSDDVLKETAKWALNRY